MESEGFTVKNPRETIKQAYQIELFSEKYVWLKAFFNRNMTTHIYNEELVKEFVKKISQVYLDKLTILYKKLME